MTRYLQPIPSSDGGGPPLAGSLVRFDTVDRLAIVGDELRTERLAAGALDRADRERLTSPRPPPFDRPCLMGILNVTPDSFSDGGEHVAVEAAVEHGRRLVDEGAAIIDVGGESTRPGAREVGAEEELRRVIPVVERLAAAGATVSIDTRKAVVMRRAIAAGASIINDVSALRHDPLALATAAELGVTVVLMHSREAPSTMNRAPTYRHPAIEVHDELAARIDACEAAGVPRSRIVVDPGIAFAKHEPHNLDILRRLALLHGLGCPVLLGASRKGWTAALHERWRPRQRLAGSLVACQWALERGVMAFRVHDVDAHRQLIAAWSALRGAGGP